MCRDLNSFEKRPLKMKNTRVSVICLLVCICLAATLAEEHEAHRVKRVTCGGIVERWFGNGACSGHCKLRGKSSGRCNSGTCYCSGGSAE